jgi:aminocarboxymuconate-semialdehyde decarboxylase
MAAQPAQKHKTEKVPKMEHIALDVHAHLVPVLSDRLAAFAGISFDSAKGTLSVDGREIGMEALYKPATLIAWMDENAVGHAFISAPPPTYRDHLRGEAAALWSAYLTEGLTALAEPWRARLSVLAQLPSQDPAAAYEAAAAALQRGCRRFNLPAGGAGAPALSESAYEPLWACLNEVEAFVFVHPGECCDERLGPFYLSNLLGNPYETTVAIAHLVFGGILARFPKIRFCFAHGGGAAAMLAGRFERGFATKRPGVDPSLPSPRTLLKRLCVDCIVHDDAALETAEAVFGTDRILFGSDWPFPMGLKEPHRQLAALAPERRRRIFCDNLSSNVGNFD